MEAVQLQKTIKYNLRFLEQLLQKKSQWNSQNKMTFWNVNGKQSIVSDFLFYVFCLCVQNWVKTQTNTMHVPQDGRKKFVIRELFSAFSSSLRPGRPVAISTDADEGETKNENG